jgi:hypothetical protein
MKRNGSPNEKDADRSPDSETKQYQQPTKHQFPPRGASPPGCGTIGIDVLHDLFCMSSHDCLRKTLCWARTNQNHRVRPEPKLRQRSAVQRQFAWFLDRFLWRKIVFRMGTIHDLSTA